MIKCSNCGMLNIDGTLLCEGCAWDVSMEPRVEDTDPEAAAVMAAPVSNPSGSFDVLQPSGSFDDLPAAEIAPVAEPLPDFPIDEPLLDAPMAAPASQIKAPTAVQPPPMAAPVSEIKAPTAVQPPMAAPVSQVKGPTAVQPPMAAPASQMRPPTAVPPAPSQMRPPTAVPPAPASQMRPPTAVPPAPASQMRPPTAIPPIPDSQVRPPTAVPPRPSQVKPPTGMPPAGQAPRVSMLAPELRPRLVVVRGLRTDAEYPLYDGPNFIGRFGENPVDIDLVDQEAAENPRASRQHACLTYENGAMFIQDLGSANGTFINRIRVNPNEKKPLKNGDYIQTGTVLFQVKEGGIV